MPELSRRRGRLSCVAHYVTGRTDRRSELDAAGAAAVRSVGGVLARTRADLAAFGRVLVRLLTHLPAFRRILRGGRSGLDTLGRVGARCASRQGVLAGKRAGLLALGGIVPKRHRQLLSTLEPAPEDVPPPDRRSKPGAVSRPSARAEPRSVGIGSRGCKRGMEGVAGGGASGDCLGGWG